MFKTKLFALFALLFSISCFAQNSKVISPDLIKLVKQNKITTYNRSVTTNSQNKNEIHLDAKDNYGVAWLNDSHFNSGVLELDIKGKNAIQQSFVGIAFHGINDSSFDCIYFRPFNFNAGDTMRKNHSVQYISMPQYDWEYLREKSPNKYENALTKSIDANSWFHAKVIVDVNEIKVFVNGDDKPSLTIKPLNNYSTGKIGFWVGNNSDGDFLNLIIKQN